jgi:hypothetical protein
MRARNRSHNHDSKLRRNGFPPPWTTEEVDARCFHHKGQRRPSTAIVFFDHRSRNYSLGTSRCKAYLHGSTGQRAGDGHEKSLYHPRLFSFACHAWVRARRWHHSHTPFSFVSEERVSSTHWLPHALAATSANAACHSEYRTDRRYAAAALLVD